ncbi:MAG: exo-beta-N-acetylmuramidase NamZ domain-containing protein [Allosphingosinicella sp.]
MVRFGIDRLLADPELRRPLEGKRVALLAHPASVTEDLTHSLDALVASGLNVTAAFGPQHGLRGDKQDNMVESDDFTDPAHNIPVFSLYGEVRRPTGQSMGTFDTILVDLQDLGCRIYTFITTLLYVLEAAAKHGKSVWVLDRPNPAGRPVEGLTLRPGWESFVGAGPLPMRHGLTLGELGRWFVETMKLDVDYRVIEMEGYEPAAAPGFGWPLGRIWINPSPNAANLWMARAYAGTVMLEGTTLSEGRGTTRPLELFGAPDLDPVAILAEMRRLAPEWLRGCALRTIAFEPTFHKHAGKTCHGLHIHPEGAFYDHDAFRPWRLQALAFKAIRRLMPGYDLWRDFAYEYEFGKLAIDVINGGPALREWVDDPASAPADLDALTGPDEQAWRSERDPFLLYSSR